MITWIIKTTEETVIEIECEGHVELEDGFILFCDKKGDVARGFNLMMIHEFYIKK